MAEGGSVVATYAYDEWGRLTAETRGSNVIGYRYDRRHQTRIAYPDGKTLTSTFDAAGQLTHLDDWRGSSTGRTAYTYDGAGRRTGRTLPNGVTTSWTFDDANRLTVLEHKQTSSGPTIFKATSTYDHVGRRLTQTDYEPGRTSGIGFPLANVLPATRVSGGSGSPWYVPASRVSGGSGSPNAFPAARTSILDTTTQTFTVACPDEGRDDAGRLTQETRTGFPAMSWTYDDAGNRLTETNGGTTTSYVYDDDNRLTSQTTAGVTTDFTYDANGSLVGRSKTGETLAYTWDAAARLTEIIRNSASQATFTYDGDGNRRTKSSGGLTTTYVNGNYPRTGYERAGIA